MSFLKRARAWTAAIALGVAALPAVAEITVSAPPPANRPMSIFGWGRTSGNTAWNSHAFLMRVGLNVMPHSECTPFARQLRWSLDDTIICAKAPSGTRRKTCKGDSGGPVVASGKLLAVVSGGGDRCTGDGVPSMYTRIAAYLPWIDGTTKRAAR